MIAIVASCLLGGLYYATSTRLYEARASLLVIPNGTDIWNPSAAVDGSRQALIPTYVQLFYEDVVLERAVDYLKALPRMQIDFRDVPPDKWSVAMRKNLSVERERRTNLIQIAYRSRDPRVAEATVAAINRSYLDFIDKNHRDISSEIVRILDQERGEVEQRLRETQMKLLSVKHQSGDIGLGNTSQVVHPAVQRVLSLNNDLIEVQQKRLDLQATLAAIKNAIQTRRDLRQYLVAIEPVVGRELLMNALGLSPQYAELSGKIEQRLIEDRARLEKLLEHYGVAHPKVIEAQKVIQEAEQYLLDYQRNVEERLKRMSSEQLGPMLVAMLQEKSASGKAHEEELTRQYKIYESSAIELNDRLAEAAIVENEVERLQHLHDTLLNRIAGIDINQNQADVRVTVVSEAVAGNRPVSPRLLLTALCCLVGGSLLGAGAVYVQDLLDDRFQTPEDMQQQLDASLLGLIRVLPATDGEGIAGVWTYAEPESPESEAFRTLRTAITFSGRVSECLAVTSAEPGDGKTTVLANLGITYARAGKRTLLIDADMRRPGLSRALDVRGVAGLSQLLLSDQPVDQTAATMIRSTLLTNLHVLPTGVRATDPAELLTRPRFAELLAWACGTYHQVLVDCPPVMAASDAAIVSRQTDGALLVLQPDKNHRRLVLRAVQSLRAMQVKLVGLVANRVGDHGAAGYFGQAYGYTAYDYGNDADFGEEAELPHVVPVRRRAA